MVATLQSRKEALEAKILEKNEELKKLCLQEADLTGVIPPEIPLEPGEPPPPIRRRVGTSFSFPQNLLNNIKDADDESLIALEVECKVQTNIAEAALTLANDTTVNKAARRKHRLMYRQSQRRLSELEARLNLLRQGKAEQGKPQQVKKKPRPNTTAVENLGYMWSKGQPQVDNQQYNGSNWMNKRGYSADELDGSRELSHSDIFGSLHRSYKSSGASQGSSSPKVDLDSEDSKSQSLSGLHITNQFPSTGSYPSIQDMLINKPNVKVSTNTSHHKRSPKRAVVRKQWDTQSAGGTLLPNQTYPDHSHQPNLSRAQSLGSVEANSQRSGKASWNAHDFPLEGGSAKEKEWYETSLDSAPSPPLRTLSRLPSTARMLYQMQEMQSREWNGMGMSGIQQSNSNPALSTPNPTHRSVVRSVSAYQTAENSVTDELAHSMQQMNLSVTPKPRVTNYYVNDNTGLMQNEFGYGHIQSDNRNFHDFSKNKEHLFYQPELKQKQEFAQLDAEGDEKYVQSDNVSLIRQNSLTLHKYKGNALEPEAMIKKQETVQDNNFRQNDAIYINIPEDNAECSTMKNWMSDGEYARSEGKPEFQPKPKVATQPYYHSTKPKQQAEKIENLQYQAARNRYNVENQPNVPVHHPPHAITQNEITFDTVVPFESPQNHTVVQAGKWQPYREVTKPFEMSDFYKYSTKFRQNNLNTPKPQTNRASTPEIPRSSPNALNQKAVYTPLRPMTCHPIESKPNHLAMPPNQVESFDDEIDHNHLVEVSLPEIV
ncbi:UNVERIFIED_CONTAM: hypothetical protein PYX00_003344 [Menopon gallinae]|uniref:Cytohesin Ubiquitin Protein Inducing domain-containing protein n=1 Tax=Menopon gallinae TaxID=328185 RepID=A0AAW2HZZ3_9NEOP